MSSTVTVNGKTYRGNSVEIRSDGKVVIDGKVQDDAVEGVVEVRVVEGRLNNLKTDGAVTCQNVEGNVSAGGSVRSGNVGGNVSSGGSARCGNVGGSVNAGGSVRHG